MKTSSDKDLLFNGIVDFCSIVRKHDDDQRRLLFELPLTFIDGVPEMLIVDEGMKIFVNYAQF